MALNSLLTPPVLTSLVTFMALGGLLTGMLLISLLTSVAPISPLTVMMLVCLLVALLHQPMELFSRPLFGMFAHNGYRRIPRLGAHGLDHRII